MTTPLLSVRGVTTFYGRVQALRGVDLDVNDGEIVTLIGANGAGKSTLMMTICGNPRARAGAIVFAGQDITRMPTHEIARLKLAQAPEGRRIFSRMTVLENLQMGATVAEPALFENDLARVLGLFPRLKQRLGQRGGTLSGGEQQMLAIARALMINPALMLLDEPFEGLAPVIVDELTAAMKTMLAGRSIAIVLVEQHTDIALELAAEAIVLERGAVVHRAPSRELQKDLPTLERLVGLRVAASA
jgi:branched-chain amino acid transport system ATP-binding protein